MTKRRTDNTMTKRKKTKKTNNDLQNTTQKTIDRETGTPLNSGDELGCRRKVSSSCSTSCTRATYVTGQGHSDITSSFQGNIV